jgi:hypothetical protein
MVTFLGHCQCLRDACTTGVPILMAFNSGSYARTVESQDDATVTANIMAVLRKLYGKNIPSPTQVLLLEVAGCCPASSSASVNLRSGQWAVASHS